MLRPEGGASACPESKGIHGKDRSQSCDHARLHRVQAAQLPDDEVEAERSGPHRVQQVLPLVRQAYAPPGDALGGARGRRWRGTRPRPGRGAPRRHPRLHRRVRRRAEEGRMAEPEPGDPGHGRRDRRLHHRRRLPLAERPGLEVPRREGAAVAMFRWYVVNTYSGHENKVKANLEHRIESMGQRPRFRRVVVPTEQVIETKDGQKVQAEKRVLPGYVLVNMDLNDDAWTVVKNTPGVTGFVGAGSKPVPLSPGEVDRILKTGASTAERPRAQVEFQLGESVKVTSGPLSDFDGEIVDVNPDQQKLKVLVDIFERQVPVELSFDQVKKID